MNFCCGLITKLVLKYSCRKCFSNHLDGRSRRSVRLVIVGGFSRLRDKNNLGHLPLNWEITWQIIWHWKSSPKKDSKEKFSTYMRRIHLWDLDVMNSKEQTRTQDLPSIFQRFFKDFPNIPHRFHRFTNKIN